MRAVVQRVARARVVVDGQAVGEIGRGLAILLGVGPEDDEPTARGLVDKIVGMRIFEDDQGKTNLAATDVGAQVLIVSSSRSEHVTYISRHWPPPRARPAG